MRTTQVFFILIFILLGCSTANKNATPAQSDLLPPDVANWPINNQLFSNKDFDSIDIFLNRAAKENPSISTSWWADYRRAQLWTKKDKNVACENFSRLAGDPLFPLGRLAYLRAHAICPANNQILSRLDTFNLDQFDSWLSEPALDVAIKKAKIKEKQSELSDLYLKKSKMNLRKEEKLGHARTALHYANKIKDIKRINTLEKRLYNLSPSTIPKPSFREYLAVAHDYRYLRNFDQAIFYYNKVIADKRSSASDKISALKGIRTAYKIQQKKSEAIVATEKLAQFVEKTFRMSKKSFDDAKLYLDTQLLLARTYWTEDRNKDALIVLSQAEKKIGRKTSLAELYWIRGRMAEEKSDFAASIDWFTKALNDTIESENFRNKVKWYLAWNERKVKNYSRSIAILKDLQSAAESNYDKSRYSFWLAKTFADSGDKDNAKDTFKELLKEDPLSYYGLLAHREKNTPLPTKTIKRVESEKIKITKNITTKLKKHVDENYLNWLVATKENSVADAYLNSVASTLRQEKVTDYNTWLSLLRLYATSDNYLSLFTQLQILDSDLRRDIIDRNPEIIFPNPYFETVTQAASRFGLSVEFIYSIMRQESAFNPQARSQMDAFGLMQLLPEVAKKSATANDISFQNTEDLYAPQINIPIGSAHLRELWDKYNGELVLAVASYNASENAILSWLKTRYRGDTLEFIEDIPYDETRDYVKLVMRNLVTYKILSANEENLLFPEWTLHISYQDTNI